MYISGGQVKRYEHHQLFAYAGPRAMEKLSSPSALFGTLKKQHAPHVLRPTVRALYLERYEVP